MNNTNKIILDLCGGTGAWNKPYKEAGYDVRNITLPDYDVRTYIPPDNVYGILAAPPCTKFSKATWYIKKKDRDFKQGMLEVRACLNIIWAIQENGAPLQFWALENPMGYLNRFLGHPVYYFQPWWFGEKSFLATKRTYLWGYFKYPARTIRKRTIPFISPYSSKRDLVNKEKNNKGWLKANAEQRAITPLGFAKAFFEANK
jgi:hypothetical protein